MSQGAASPMETGERRGASQEIIWDIGREGRCLDIMKSVETRLTGSRSGYGLEL
jgi:hypothetical protein